MSCFEKKEARKHISKLHEVISNSTVKRLLNVVELLDSEQLHLCFKFHSLSINPKYNSCTKLYN